MATKREIDEVLSKPFCLHKWEIIESMIDPTNPTINDKILFATKRMEELGINHFQTWGEPCKYLNTLFGMAEGKYTNCEYGVQSVWVSGYDYGLCSRIARVEIIYNKGSMYDTYHISVGRKVVEETKTDKNGFRNHYRSATDAETETIYQYLLSLINDRVEEIKSHEDNPTFDEFKNLCIEYCKKFLSIHSLTYEFEIDSFFGRRATEDTDKFGIVFYYKNYKGSPLGQKGYINITQNQFKEYTLECLRTLCGGTYSKLSNWKDYEEVLKHQCSFILL